MTTRPLIGLYSSAPQSGKSETAKTLIEGFGFELVKFAGPLKDMARGLFRGMGIDAETIDRMVEGDLKEVPIPGLEVSTPRRVMETLGTDWGREAIDTDLWLKVAERRINTFRGAGSPVVVDDVRFENEFYAIRDLGGVCVRVTRPMSMTAGSRYEGRLDRFKFDHVIVNDGDLDDLRQAVLDMVNKATGRGA